MTGDGGGAAQVTWTTVDGVRVVHADEPGPLRASLVFRVGKTDETLPTNGITHLVEHLTLFPLGQRPHYQNGSVRTSVTTFDVSGEADEVARFLTGVCTGLRALPIDRLETEVRVLDTEAGHRGYGMASTLLTWRFGPSGPGLWAYDELATSTVDGGRLQAWADERFTKQNAVLVLSGPPPAGLELPLGEGGSFPVPALADVLPSMPSWFRHGYPDVAALAPIRRSIAAVAYAHCLRDALIDRLRFDQGIAYSPTVDYDPYDDDTALLWIVGDSHPEHLEDVTDVLTSTIASLAEDGPTSEKVEEYRTTARRMWDSPDAPTSRAYSEALELLFSGSLKPIEERMADLESLTLADVHAVARTAKDSMLYALPEDVEMPEGQAEPAPELSTEPAVDGVVHEALVLDLENADRLILGDEGVSVVRHDGVHATVRFASCRGVLAWPDGRRVLIAPDGVSVTVEPTLWERGEDVVAAIDEATAAVRVPRPERAPEDIPVPTLPQTIKRDFGSRRTGSKVMMGAGVGLTVLGVTSAVSALGSPTGGTFSRAIPIVWGLSLFFWGLVRD
jgi:hypothetical protein